VARSAEGSGAKKRRKVEVKTRHWRGWVWLLRSLLSRLLPGVCEFCLRGSRAGWSS
jgi:hypothetical protein